MALTGVGAAIAAPAAIDTVFGSGGPEPIKKAPADDPANGMIYAGLQPAKRGDLCVGAYQVAERGQCSHGPDAPPVGLNVRNWTAPVAATASVPAVTRDGTLAPKEAEVTADEGGFTTVSGLGILPDAVGTVQSVLGVSGVACNGDGVSGKRVQVLYARAVGTASRFAQYVESFRTWSAGVDAIYDASAQETGGSRHIRFVTTADCKVDVQEVEVPAGGMDTFNATVTALKTLGFNRLDRKYLIFGDSNVYCGIATFAGDEQAGAGNRSNSGPSYGRSDSGCWTASVAAHELGHNLGAVNNSAPNSSKAGHCIDEYDVMCYNDSGGLKTTIVCADRAHDQRLDCNHDDYYNTNPSAGSYLATHWNVADNDFLIKTEGTTPPPPSPTTSPPTPSPPAGSPSPSITASPTPSKTSVSPTPSKTASPTPTGTAAPPTGLKDLRSSDVTPTSMTLTWDGAAPGSRYTIVLNGQPMGQVGSTRVRIHGMNPDTDYPVGVAIAKGGGLSPYTKTIVVHTLPSPVPAPSSWLVFDNGLTGGVADLFGARTAPGTPLILYRMHGGANQLWKLEPAAAGGGFTIRNKATNLCVAPQDGREVEGTPVVQQACDRAPLWTLTKTTFGSAITSAGGLVIGVSNERFFDNRLLVLQRPTDARYQSWTAQPA